MSKTSDTIDTLDKNEVLEGLCDIFGGTDKFPSTDEFGEHIVGGIYDSWMFIGWSEY